MTTPARLLATALAADPSRPLLTYYDDSTGERTELSVATFANWVAKTANLLRDDLDLQPGARAEVDLPLHWQAAVWLQACWAMRLVVVIPSGTATQPVDLAVVTHDRAKSHATEVVSLGLGAMGLARPGSLPACEGAMDYDREVHGHGDLFTPSSQPLGEDPAIVAGGTTLSGGELAGAATAADRLPSGGRLLVTTALTTPAAIIGALLVPLATGVTGVLCRHLDPARLSARVLEENLVAVLDDAAASTGTVPAWGSLHR